MVWFQKNYIHWEGFLSENARWTFCRANESELLDLTTQVMTVETFNLTRVEMPWTVVSGPCRLDVEGCMDTFVMRPEPN